VSTDLTERQAVRTHGQFTATVETAELDAEAARLRSRSMSYRAIAEQLSCSVSVAHDRVQRGLAAVRSEPAAALVALELAKLDRLEEHLLAVMEREHPLCQHGRVVTGPDGEPLTDPGPPLAAAAQLVRCSESRRKLLGMDASVKVDLSGGVRYEIVMPGQIEGEGL